MAFAVAVATPGCPLLCTLRVINRDIRCSLGSSIGCFSSYDTMALSILPPTLIISLSSMNRLNTLSSPFFIRLFKSFWAFLIRDTSAFFKSSGMRGPFPPLVAFLLRRIFSANRLIHTVTLISFRQLEKFFTPITFPTLAGETAVTVIINVTMLHISSLKSRCLDWSLFLWKFQKFRAV